MEHRMNEVQNAVDKRGFVCRLILLGVAAAIFFNFILMRVPGFFRGQAYTTFLFHPEDRFNDFWNICKPFFFGGNPYLSRFSVYFPAVYVILLPFRFAGEYALPCFFFTACGAFFLVTFLLQKDFDGFRRGRLSIALMLTYPFLFTIDRANVELILIVLILLWLWFRKKGCDVLASLCLGLAGAAKIYPFLFLLPDLVELRFRRLILTSVTAVLFSVCGLLILGDSFVATAKLLSTNLSHFHSHYIFERAGIAFSVSLLSCITALWISVGSALFSSPPPLEWLPIDYWPVLVYAGLALMLIGAWYLRHEDEWKSVFVAVSAMVLLPPVSFDYKLLHLLIPLLMFLQAPPSRDDRLISSLFVLLLVPKAYFFLFDWTSVSVVINPILILVMLWVLFRSKGSPSLVVDGCGV